MSQFANRKNVILKAFLLGHPQPVNNASHLLDEEPIKMLETRYLLMKLY